MTETRIPLAVPEGFSAQLEKTLAELKETYETTGTITEYQFGWLYRGVILTEDLMEASATFANIADATVRRLETVILEQEEELAEKDREIASLSIQLRDKERDLELVNADV